MDLKIRGKIWRAGKGSYVLTIPKAIIECGNLHLGDTITVEVIEHNQETPVIINDETASQ